MGRLFTANRVAAIATWLAALGGLVAAFQGVFPAGWQNTVLAAVALLAKAGVAAKFLQGSQKWDALQAPVPVLTAALPIDQNIYEEGTAELLAVPVHVPDPNFNPVSRLAPQREDEAARSPSNPEVPS